MKIRYLLIYILITVSFLVNGQTISFEDPNFESILLSSTTSNNIALNEFNQSIALDLNENGQIEIEESELVFELNIPINSNIESLLGIEFFNNLTHLHCTYNLLTELNVSMLTNLEFLQVGNNQLETLEFNPQLQILGCPNNEIESLDFLLSTNLESLDCANNNLTELNLSSAQNLRILNCRDNQLTSLMIQYLPLININCNNNQLVELNLYNVGDSSSGTPLIIDCLNNQFINIDTTTTENSEVSLNCSNNANLVSLNLKNGETFYDSSPQQPPSSSVRFDNNINLETICADEFNFEYLQTKLNESNISNCELTSDCTLSIKNFNEESFILYPNPIKDNLVIKCPLKYNYLVVYNFIGQIVFEINFELDKPIDLSFLSSGNYIAKLITKDDSKQFEIIKK